MLNAHLQMFEPWKSSALSDQMNDNVFIYFQTAVYLVPALRPRQNCRHFADVFKCIFFNENMLISLKISLMCVLEVRINNIPALVQIMTWRRPGDKPLSESMMFNLLTYEWVTWPQWVNSSAPERCKHNFTNAFFKFISQIDILNASCAIVVRWMPQNPNWW